MAGPSGQAYVAVVAVCVGRSGRAVSGKLMMCFITGADTMRRLPDILS